MDDTMFARWMLSAVPELPVACAALRVLGAEEAAEGVEQVAALLGVEVRRALVDGRHTLTVESFSELAGAILCKRK